MFYIIIFLVIFLSSPGVYPGLALIIDGSQCFFNYVCRCLAGALLFPALAQFFYKTRL